MNYKIYEDCEGYHVRTLHDEYIFSTDTKDMAEHIIRALKEYELILNKNYKKKEM